MSHTIEEAKRLECRVVGLFTIQNTVKLPHGIVGLNGATEQVELQIKTLQCCANACGHWVWDLAEPMPALALGDDAVVQRRGRCGLAR